MNDGTAAAQAPASPPFYRIAGIDFRNLIWVAGCFAVLVYAVAAEAHFLLRWIHVTTGVLMTGADILLGFLVGPILRSLPFEARRGFSLKLLPRTLFLMPTLGIIAPASGWYLAVELGYLDMGYPEFWWVIAALAVAAMLALQGLGILLPTNLRAYLEMRKDAPDMAKVGRIMRRYFIAVASQGLMQVAIIIIMVRMSAGL